MALGELVDELRVKGVVDGRPQAQPRFFPLVQVLRRDGARGFCLKTGLDVLGETVAKGAEAVDGARDAVEGDAFEADFAD